jgi:hypothetical protein
MSIALFKSRDESKFIKRSSWNNQDIADFYRAVDILKQAGLSTEVDSGVTDEGDPWFVFLRPDNGDVIAHFAQTDNQFIAVSSLNQEVYRGQDIRAIVNQMLERHPMLLPQNKNGGRLYLHPTAALSAFLAAAFILTIDGVKASNIHDVMAGVAAEGLKQSPNNTIQPEIGLRSEPLKAMLSDMSSSNYNVAVLGAVLIVHELSQKEVHFDSQIGLHASYNITDDGEKQVEEMPARQDIGAENSRKAEYDDRSNYSVNEAALTTDEHEPEQDNADSASKELVKADKKYKNLILDEQVDTAVVLAQDYQVVWDEADLGFNPIHDLAGAAINNSISDQYIVVDQFNFEDNHKSTEPDLAFSMDNFAGPFSVMPLEFVSEITRSRDDLGVTLNVAGESRLVSLGSLALENELKELSTTSQEGIGGVKDKEGQSISKITLEGSYSPEREQDIDSSTALLESNVLKKPIIGHSLTGSGDSLQLSEALDVVFYEGGDSEIKGFELGTDLLWFFLSPEELSTATKTISDQGNLVLDFDNIGTLTFLGIVNEPSIEAIV